MIVLICSYEIANNIQNENTNIKLVKTKLNEGKGGACKKRFRVNIN